MYKNCAYCNSEFYVKPYHLKRGWGRFCSRICLSRGRKTGEQVTCHVCQRQVYRMPSEIKKNNQGKTFCSKSCQTVWRNSYYSADKHTAWKGGEGSYRQRMLRAGRSLECRRCREKDQRVLVVHHIDENRENNSLDNLVWLCHNCHYLVHCDRLEKDKLAAKPLVK